MTVYIKLFLSALFWGGTFIAARIASQQVDPFSGAFLRFAIASIFLLLYLRGVEGGLPRLKKEQIIPVVLLGLTGVFAYNYFFFSGLKTIFANRASVIVATNPIFITLFAVLLFKEKLTAVNYAGIVLCAFGVLLVISKGHPLLILSGGIGIGELYILGCVASWVSYSLIGKRALQGMSPLTAVTYSCVIGCILLFGPAWAEGMFSSFSEYRTVDWISIAYLGFFGSALGFTWYYQGIQKIGASRAAAFINFVPVSAVILAFFFLKEPLTWSIVVGAATVISGVLLTNIRH